MPTACKFTACMTTGQALVVAGGREDLKLGTNTVEVTNINTKQWTTVCSLPLVIAQPGYTPAVPGYNPTVTYCAITGYIPITTKS